MDVEKCVLCKKYTHVGNLHYDGFYSYIVCNECELEHLEDRKKICRREKWKRVVKIWKLNKNR